MSNQTLSKVPRLALIACLAGALAVAFVHRTYAQDSRIVCSSNGYRSFCDADTRGGVMLLRELRNSQQCVEGATWGYTDRGVWVDRGCRAQFELTQAPPPPSPVTRIEPGTIIPVRTDAYIDSRRADGRIYTSTVTDDVRGDDGRVGIPRGSGIELAVRVAPDGDLILDLDSVVAYGQRYSLAADRPIRNESNPVARASERTAGPGNTSAEERCWAPSSERLLVAAKAQPSEQPRERPPARVDRSSPAAASSACRRSPF